MKMPKTTEGSTTKPQTLNLTFSEPEDVKLYDHIVAAAKAERRTPSMYALLALHDAVAKSITAAQ